MQDRFDSENMLLTHCPTAAMLADFFTKPLQGALFKRFRSVILGYEPISFLDPPCLPDPPLLPIAERVGNNEVQSSELEPLSGYEVPRRTYAAIVRG